MRPLLVDLLDDRFTVVTPAVFETDFVEGEQVTLETDVGSYRGVVTDVTSTHYFVETDKGGRLQINRSTKKVLVLHDKS